jgi:hypothetical protein
MSHNRYIERCPVCRHPCVASSRERAVSMVTRHMINCDATIQSLLSATLPSGQSRSWSDAFGV